MSFSNRCVWLDGGDGSTSQRPLCSNQPLNLPSSTFWRINLQHPRSSVADIVANVHPVQVCNDVCTCYMSSSVQRVHQARSTWALLIEMDFILHGKFATSDGLEFTAARTLLHMICFCFRRRPRWQHRCKVQILPSRRTAC